MDTKTPPLLRVLAREAGKDPALYLEELLDRHISIADAALEIEVTPKTLYNWRRQLGLVKE